MDANLGVKISFDVAGLDEILFGGVLARRAYLVRGGPGSGKTTLGLHFLMAGIKRQEKTLFITLEEPEQHIRASAKIRGINLEGIDFLDLSPNSTFFSDLQMYDIFSPAEVEREPITQQIIDTVNKSHPTRVFIDPMTQFRYLSSDVFQFRRQVLSFLRFLIDQGATVLFTSEGSKDAPDDDLQFMSDGVINLTSTEQGRFLSISKLRNSDFQFGNHSMRLTKGGMEVYRRLIPEQHTKLHLNDQIPSGVTEIDKLLHGGIERGTVTLLTGPSGVGKTTLGLQFMKEASLRKEYSILYSFEEEVEIMMRRAEQLKTPVHEMIESGKLKIMKVEPLRWSADEFAQQVRREVESNGARIVMIDSLAGYTLTVRGENLQEHVHALVKYLQNMGVVTLLVADVSSILGDFRITENNISYLADNVIFLRYLEMSGELRKAIGVLKKRTSDFEKTLREFTITPDGIKVGRPLTELRGILLGTPNWVSLQDKGSEK